VIAIVRRLFQRRELYWRSTPAGVMMPSATGIDHDTAPSEVGTRFGTPGYFRVQLRFPSAAEAEKAAAQMRNYTEDDGKFFAVVAVPAISRETMDDDPPPEIKVSW
jgi:hypothetical protein